MDHASLATNVVSPRATRPQLLDAFGRPYEPAVSPRLKALLLGFIFPCVAVLGATGVYLIAIKGLGWAQYGWDGIQRLISPFWLWMFFVHVVVGVLLIVPFLYFGVSHLIAARNRSNRVAVRLGIMLFISSLVVGLTGAALIQIDALPKIPTETLTRKVVYGLHALVPLIAVALYVLHRRAGPDIQWKWGGVWGGALAVFIAVMGVMHSHDPRKWYAKGSPEGEKYFEPSKSRTVDGNFISAQTLMMDEYCLKCHRDIYNDHIHSAHKFSSFNNPAYLFSVLETRKVGNQRDGNPRASRWCAGCHDPVPFFSGAFDEPVFSDPNFNVSKHPTAAAGITCTVCHAQVNINTTIGNGDYTIEEPIHYPFAYSDHPVLQWMNNQLVKAKPEFHKQTFLKPFHRTAEFCSTCHKVSLPMQVNHYKEFLRGQNHPDTFHLSGVSGINSRSFYYPPKAKDRCAECHMPLKESTDFGARDFDGSGVRKIHRHLQLGANTGVPRLLELEGHKDKERIIKAHEEFLKDKQVRIDLFGVKDGAAIDAKLIAPLRPQLPKLQPGKTYLVEVVVRTLGLGHPLTQGTADSNELWVDFTAKSGDRVIGRNGALQDEKKQEGPVDEWSHFINILMLDRNGNRIDRRNPQDIFTPLYNHQIPPGAAGVVHYQLDVPKDVKAPIDLTVKLRFRKFDHPYMKYVHKDKPVPPLPIVDMCEDHVTLPVAGIAENVPAQESGIKPPWQRWNDYGIAFFLTAQNDAKRPGLLQAEEAFQKLTTMEDKDPRAHGFLNLARTYVLQGNILKAAETLSVIEKEKLPAPWWTVAWFTGLVNAQNGRLDEAIQNFEQILDPKNQPEDRKFNFAKDWIVINELGKTLFVRSQQEDPGSPEQKQFLRRAIEQYQRTLKLEPEDMDAHYGLFQCFSKLGDLGTASAELAVRQRRRAEGTGEGVRQR